MRILHNPRVVHQMLSRIQTWLDLPTVEAAKSVIEVKKEKATSSVRENARKVESIANQYTTFWSTHWTAPHKISIIKKQTDIDEPLRVDFVNDFKIFMNNQEFILWSDETYFSIDNSSHS